MLKKPKGGSSAQKKNHWSYCHCISLLITYVTQEDKIHNKFLLHRRDVAGLVDVVFFVGANITATATSGGDSVGVRHGKLVGNNLIKMFTGRVGATNVVSNFIGAGGVNISKGAGVIARGIGILSEVYDCNIAIRVGDGGGDVGI